MKIAYVLISALFTVTACGSSGDGSKPAENVAGSAGSGAAPSGNAGGAAGAAGAQSGGATGGASGSGGSGSCHNPGQSVCADGKLVRCSADGKSSTEDCPFGCTSRADGARCMDLAPSFGTALPSENSQDLVIEGAMTLNIRSCATKLVTLTTPSVKTDLPESYVSTIVQGSGAPSICQLNYRNITIAEGAVLTVDNSDQALALSATSTLTVNGTLSFRNQKVDGPGRGGDVTCDTCNKLAPGAGGGAGPGSNGGGGGKCLHSTCPLELGGTPGIAPSWEQLHTGSSGGDVFYKTWFGPPIGGTAISVRTGFGGLGGGALQLIALEGVSIGAHGVIDVSGAGGNGEESGTAAGGGGGGGMLVIESNALTVAAGGKLLANGGGGAGGCFSCSLIVGSFVCFHVGGEDGNVTERASAGGSCGNPALAGDGGNGGSAKSSATNGSHSSATDAKISGGAGGGGEGVIFIRSLDAPKLEGAIVSPAPKVMELKTK